MDKKNTTKVLIFINWYLPGYKAGGPIQSVVNLIAQLKDEIDFSIITSDSDLGDTNSYADVKLNEWIEREDGYRILYLSKGNQSAKGFKKFIAPNDYQYIYLNGVFSYRFTILPILLFKDSLAQIIIGSRGMLGKGALKIKPFKKKAFIKVMRTMGVYDKVVWQATDKEERTDILAVFGDNAKVHIASDTAAPVSSQIQVKNKVKGILKLVFLSRISEKKNLDGLIERLAQINIDGEITLDIFGPIEDNNYWSRCKALIETLPDNIKVVYKGSVPQPEIGSVLENYHFFVMLTWHENFGYAIFEALSVGCPLIISDETPWKGLHEKNIGWDISLSSLKDFDLAIESALKMDHKEYSEMAGSAHRYALDYSKNDPSIAQFRHLFEYV